MNRPAGAIMSFAQFVLNDIATNGAFLYFGFMDDMAVAPLRLLDEDATISWTALKEIEHKDDYRFYAGWTLFGYYAQIIRGPDRLLVKVRGQKALQLLLIQDRLEAELAAKEKAKKAAYKKKKLDAEWWP